MLADTASDNCAWSAWTRQGVRHAAVTRESYLGPPHEISVVVDNADDLWNMGWGATNNLNIRSGARSYKLTQVEIFH